MLDVSPRELSLPLDEATVATKTPPHSIEAEQSVLVGLMLDNQARGRVADELTSDGFGSRFIPAGAGNTLNK